MPERIEDLEIFREKFLSELTQAQPELHSYQDYLRYWKGVEQEAQHTEDLGQLDGWVRDLARDKEKVAALKNRVDTMGGKEGAQAQLLNILRMVLEMLDGIERRLRRIYNERLSLLAAMLWQGGPGGAPKPKPDEKKGDKKGEKKEADGPDALEGPALAKGDPAKKDKDKKMER